MVNKAPYNHTGWQFLPGVSFSMQRAAWEIKSFKLLHPPQTHRETSASSQHSVTWFSNLQTNPQHVLLQRHLSALQIRASELFKCAESTQCKREWLPHCTESHGRTPHSKSQSCSQQQLRHGRNTPALWLYKTVNDYRITPCNQRTKCVLQINHFPRLERKDRIER